MPHELNSVAILCACSTFRLNSWWLIFALKHHLLRLIQPEHKVKFAWWRWQPIAGLVCCSWLVNAEKYLEGAIGGPCQARCLQHIAYKVRMDDFLAYLVAISKILTMLAVLQIKPHEQLGLKFMHCKGSLMERTLSPML